MLVPRHLVPSSTSSARRAKQAAVRSQNHPQLQPKKLQNGTILAENVLIMLLYGKDRLSSG